MSVKFPKLRSLLPVALQCNPLPMLHLRCALKTNARQVRRMHGSWNNRFKLMAVHFKQCFNLSINHSFGDLISCKYIYIYIHIKVVVIVGYKGQKTKSLLQTLFL